MKKEMRVITASGDNAGLVDHGFDVNTQLNNLSFEDKGIKTKIGEVFGPGINEGEGSVKVEGSTAVAVLTASESITIDASAAGYPALRDAVRGGLLKGVVDRDLSLAVPPDFIERAAEALKAAGIPASVVESLSVKAGDYRKAIQEAVQSEAVDTLTACANKGVTFKVKYERK